MSNEKWTHLGDHEAECLQILEGDARTLVRFVGPIELVLNELELLEERTTIAGQVGHSFIERHIYLLINHRQILRPT